MQRQIRPWPLSKSLICIICSAIIALLTSPVWAKKNPSVSLLSSVGLSERQFEDEVKEYLGTPYRKGGTSTKGFDCSGFARTVYDRILGIDLPHNSGDQFNDSALQKINTQELQTGDLVFFAGSGKKKKKRINHVGVYLSDGEFIHASSTEGVMVSSLDDKYWKKRFAGSKRYVALSSVGKTNEFRQESHLEVPVHQNGVITYYTRNEFASTSPAQDDPGTTNYDPLALQGPTPATQNFNEIGYQHTLFAGFDFSISAFTEKFDVTTAWPGIDSDKQSTDSDLDQIFNTSTRRGFTLSSEYRPSSWLGFTPSITYFDIPDNTEHLVNIPKRAIGLNTQLSPMESSWSLSMLVRYTDGENITNLSSLDNKISSLDMSVKLGIAIAENLQFSIISNYDRRSMALRMTEESSLNTPVSSDVAMMFDFKY
jgi:hypothetical protein